MSRGNLIVRLLVVAVLAVVMGSPPTRAQQQVKPIEVTLKDGKASVKGELTKDDPLDVKGRKESFSKSYLVKLEASSIYRIDALSKAFDTYLRLEDSSGTEVALDDDSGPDDSNARIVYRVGK